MLGAAHCPAVAPDSHLSAPYAVYAGGDAVPLCAVPFLFCELDNNYSTLSERGDHNRTLDRSGDLGEMEPLKGAPLMVNPLSVLLSL